MDARKIPANMAETSSPSQETVKFLLADEHNSVWLKIYVIVFMGVFVAMVLTLLLLFLRGIGRILEKDTDKDKVGVGTRPGHM